MALEGPCQPLGLSTPCTSHQRSCPPQRMLRAGVGSTQPRAKAVQGVSYHHWENNSGHSGLENPEQGQAEQLDDSEKVHMAQGHVAEVSKVWLVLGWHQEQPHTVHELQREDGRWVTPVLLLGSSHPAPC